MIESTELKVLIQQVSKIADSVEQLVAIEAGRKEREKQQEKENERFSIFIADNSEPLIRLKRTHLRFDRWGDKIGFIVLIAVLTAAGFNFLA